MDIHNHKTREYVVTRCKGCMCHELDMQFGSELYHGCCNECGCPKNEEGFKWYRENHPDSLVRKK